MKIWILNHYAADMYFDKAGRHHSLAKYLIREGHEVKIFCANTVHNSEIIVDTSTDLFTEKTGEDEVPYVFVKTRAYEGNGRARILNMLDFTFRIKRVLKEYVTKAGKPDVILASSVHPLTLVAGIRFAKRIDIPCICEVRDLWPETLVEYGVLKKDSIVAKILYRGEARIYQKADQLIFTMPGGKDYITDKHLEKKVDLEKVHYLNNGVDLELFNKHKYDNIVENADLNDPGYFKVIYAGSIREANNVKHFVEMARIFEQRGERDIRFIIYGDGDQRAKLEDKCLHYKLNNICFKGRVGKQYIPYIVSSGDLNIVTDEPNNLGKYGISWNKLFDYMASGKPTLANYDMGKYNLVKDCKCGEARKFESLDEFCDAVVRIKSMSQREYDEYGDNAKKASMVFDYKSLAKDLLIIVEQTLKAYKEEL